MDTYTLTPANANLANLANEDSANATLQATAQNQRQQGNQTLKQHRKQRLPEATRVQGFVGFVGSYFTCKRYRMVTHTEIQCGGRDEPEFWE